MQRSICISKGCYFSKLTRIRTESESAIMTSWSSGYVGCSACGSRLGFTSSVLFLPSTHLVIFSVLLSLKLKNINLIMNLKKDILVVCMYVGIYYVSLLMPMH